MPSQANPAIIAGLIFVSMAGWMFGSDTGTISGAIQMQPYIDLFGNTIDPTTGLTAFTNTRQGLIVGIVNIGTLVGCLLSSPLADKYGKRFSIRIWCLVFIIGNILEITALHYQQLVVGRLVKGLGIGALSVITPSYQAETSPPNVRGAIVTTYQLFITAGILVGYAINLGTHNLEGNKSWQIPIGINFIWPLCLGIGMLFLPESPRHLVRTGQIEEAKKVVARIRRVSVEDRNVEKDVAEFQANVDEELSGGPVAWSEVFSPRIRYRTFLGIALMSLQQLSGANYFFYYGTTVFQGVGISNNFVSQLILGVVNFVCTFGGIVVLEKLGRRTPLIVGGLWMSMCFFVFSSVGAFVLEDATGALKKTAGTVMIVFSCFYILGFSTTIAGGAYVIVGESYPLRVRSKCAAIATASNWAWNFCISFFTSFIVGDIGYKYGYVFAVMCLVLSLVVYLFAKETKGLTLESIDHMYTRSDIKAWQSAAWGKKHIAELHNARVDNLDRVSSMNDEDRVAKKSAGANGMLGGGAGVAHVEDGLVGGAEKGHDYGDAPTAVNSTNPSVAPTPKVSLDMKH